MFETSLLLPMGRIAHLFLSLFGPSLCGFVPLNWTLRPRLFWVSKGKLLKDAKTKKKKHHKVLEKRNNIPPRGFLFNALGVYASKPWNLKFWQLLSTLARELLQTIVVFGELFVLSHCSHEKNLIW